MHFVAARQTIETPAPEVIAGQVDRYSKKVLAPMDLIVERNLSAEKSVVGFLKEIVGQLAISACPRQVCP
jgi:hypothetical protein